MSFPNIPSRMKVVQSDKQMIFTKTPMKTTYSQVAYNLFRDEESAMQQTNRLIFNNVLVRNLASKITTTNKETNNKLIHAAHVAERNQDVRINNRLTSEYSGIKKPDVDIAQIEESIKDNPTDNRVGDVSEIKK